MKIDNVTYRKANLSDDVEKIAVLLHETDPYIYPSMCKSADSPSWINIIAQAIVDKNNVFCLENLIVAERYGEIIGIVCYIKGGMDYWFSKGITIPSECVDQVKKVEIGYFNPLFAENKELDGYNVVNLCVLSSSRGNGVGKGLMECLIGETHGENIYLDVIASNEVAVGLYKSCGFEIAEEYYGFSGSSDQLLCYKMIRLKE